MIVYTILAWTEAQVLTAALAILGRRTVTRHPETGYQFTSFATTSEIQRLESTYTLCCVESTIPLLIPTHAFVTRHQHARSTEEPINIVEELLRGCNIGPLAQHLDSSAQLCTNPLPARIFGRLALRLRLIAITPLLSQ